MVNKKNITNLAILFVVVALASIGVFLTLREYWSSPSRYGGTVSGSNSVNLGETYPYRSVFPPYSEKNMLLPSPMYEVSTREVNFQPDQHFYVKNRLAQPIYPSQRPDLTLNPFGASGYKRVGIVYSKSRNNLKLPLYGRPKIPGGNRFDYYVLDDSIHTNPLPLSNHNGLELVSGNRVRVPGYGDELVVYTYYDD